MRRNRSTQKQSNGGLLVAIKSKFYIVLAMCTLALSINDVVAADLPLIMHQSMQVKPLTAVCSPGKVLSFYVYCEGVNVVGAQTPLFVTGTPDGTNVEIITLSEQQALINLKFPTTVARGVWVLSVKVGSPIPLIEQNIEIEVEE
jgi:hypothetical protein